MTRESAADFLIRTVLDETFRELAATDPQRAFEGYDLNDEERDILRARDGRLLGLLGHAVERDAAPEKDAALKVESHAASQPLPTLPEVKLVLRLTPFVAQGPESDPRVSYEASLESWRGTHESDANDPQPEDESEPARPSPPAEVKWLVRIAPTVVGPQEGGMMVSYAASIHPLAAGVDEPAPPTPVPTPTPVSPPWNHHVDSSAAKAAARAVLASDPNRRYEKLLDLIQALQTGDHRG